MHAPHPISPPTAFARLTRSPAKLMALGHAPKMCQRHPPRALPAATPPKITPRFSAPPADIHTFLHDVVCARYLPPPPPCLCSLSCPLRSLSRLAALITPAHAMRQAYLRAARCSLYCSPCAARAPSAAASLTQRICGLQSVPRVAPPGAAPTPAARPPCADPTSSACPLLCRFFGIYPKCCTRNCCPPLLRQSCAACPALAVPCVTTRPFHLSPDRRGLHAVACHFHTFHAY
ncbi:hypothetical protein B0H14DRAFT_3448358 [Mycena olivaceomarginata]|nr:hypothetical protein B0H14DRAFT_3448358 [Mycena olivaceomarginata]